MVILLEELTRPLQRLVFGGKIFRPRHPFGAPGASHCCQAVIIGDSIRHRYLRDSTEGRVPQRSSEIQASWADAPKLSLSRAHQFPLHIREIFEGPTLER